MKNYRIELKGMAKGLGEDSYLDCYVLDLLDGTKPRGAVLICPGGGYYSVSDREAEPVAIAFASRGYNAYVLNYSTADSCDKKYPTQLLEGYASLRYIFDNAKAHNTDTKNINICGFSAGGHLAASVGVLHNSNEVNIVFGESRPYKINRMILCYPVISAENCPHAGSFDCLIGDNKAMRNYLSLENRIDKTTPPAFLWHTSNDDVVDVHNSLVFASALRKNAVPFEMHIYPKGAHGLSLANEQTSNGRATHVLFDCAEWLDLADKFLKKEL